VVQPRRQRRQGHPCKDVIDSGFMPPRRRYGRRQKRTRTNFLARNLEEKLKARGIKTVIVCGTSFQRRRHWHRLGFGTGGLQGDRADRLPVVRKIRTWMQYAAWHLFKGGPTMITQPSDGWTHSTMVEVSNTCLYSITFAPGEWRLSGKLKPSMPIDDFFLGPPILRVLQSLE